MGKTCIPNNSEQVVTISRSLLSNALALGVKPIGSSVWGIEELRTFLSNKSFLGRKVEEIVSVGQLFNVSLEEILYLEPDLILAWEPAVEAVYPLLSQVAPTVVFSFDDLVKDWKEAFATTAKVLNREAEAQRVWDHYNQRIKDLKSAIGDRYENKTISVVGVYDGGRRAYADAKNSFIGSILEELALQRPPAQNINIDGGGTIDGISEERLELLDGDILFVLVSEFGHTEAYESLKQKPLWKKLNAVQNERVYLVDVFAWSTESPLAADAVFDDLYKYLVQSPLHELGDSL
ncbi:iron-siderophore ABC transporter substrate-binding protein [Leptolyngbya sp. NK1-12]|uniref:Iron-siderophore ABC transporter substrate-binding protein n=2 Tax=Leptolyngbya sp. NK1-12 TaxID=2547451 RepID=A0AA97AS34_9CYAN|nr:iron-siderophore ABC transporter substrate-binding protein [Leptolyngbya sp. NK1-12]